MIHTKMENNNLLRRIHLNLNTTTEMSIFKAMQEVENEVADPLLTEAGILLFKAKDLIGDYVDKKLEELNKEM